MISRIGWACCSILAAAAMLQSQEPTGDRVSVPFSDPSRPKTVKVSTMNGAVTVRGYNGREVVVEARGRADSRHREREDERSKGLRRLNNTSTGLTVEEQDNTVSINTRNNAELMIEVPVNTSVRVEGHNGEVRVENVTGEVDANSLNGSVRLLNISGAVIAHSLNGEVNVVMDKVTPDKPMSFSTMNGSVDVTLPPSTRARLKLKTDRGEIFSDFEVKLDASTPVTTDNRKEGGKYRIQFGKALYGSINGGGPEYQFTTLNGKIYVRKK